MGRKKPRISPTAWLSSMKRIAVISDLQCGSVFGMLPPDFITAEGVPKLQNSGQRYTWDCWLDFASRLKEFKPDAIIANGDMNDGRQRKSDGVELSLNLISDQIRAAVRCLNVIKKSAPSAKWYFTRGTAYHVGHAGQDEEEIAKQMNGEKYPSVGTGIRVREVLWLDVDGVIIEAAHHIGVSQGFYRLTQLDKEMQWSAMAAKDNTKGVPKADLIIRSHVHNFQSAEHASKQGIVTPCWQLQTSFMRKNSTYRMLPDIGGVFIEVDGKAKAKGRPPCRILKELYPLPAVEVTKL
jgi:hypothetical protein